MLSWEIRQVSRAHWGGLWEARWGFWCSGFGLMAMLFFQFSLMQFSNKFLVHFTFKHFMDNSDPLGLLDSVYQLKGYTHTATAIQMVM